MVAEVTMIGIDNSGSMLPRVSMHFEQQIEAIELYCRAKFDSNPKNTVGALTLGSIPDSFLAPTSDLEKIRYLLKALPRGGYLDFHCGISFTNLGFVRHCPEGMRKRMLLFVGGGISFTKDSLVRLGNKLKEDGVAVDVVSFVHDDPKLDKRKSDWLEAFVHAANKNNNSHIAYLKPGSRICDVLSRAEIIPQARQTNKAVAYGDEHGKPYGMKMKNHHMFISKLDSKAERVNDQFG